MSKVSSARYSRTPPTWIALLVCAALSVSASAEEAQTAKHRVTKLTEKIYLLQGNGGNIGAFVGAGGVLLVDSGFAWLAKDLDNTLRKIDAGPIRYVVNTHWHGDHAGGNDYFSRTATIIAHPNVRKRFQTRQEINYFDVVQPQRAAAAYPSITYTDALTLYFNGERVDIVHYPNIHTDGDSVVYFPDSNVAHLGDGFFRHVFPFVHQDSGGSIVALARHLDHIIDRLRPDVKIIPGHQDVATLDDLKRYRDMIKETLAIVAGFRAKGMTLAEAQRQSLHPQWASWNRGWVSTRTWIEHLYRNLENQQALDGQ